MPKKRDNHPLERLTFSAQKLGDVTPSQSAETTKQPVPEELTESKEEKVETRASNITLPVSVWDWIDAKHAEARSDGGKAIRKSALIRAVFEVVMSVDVELAGAQSEQEITDKILEAIRQ